MRILVVYTSRYGQTRKIAERIAAVTRQQGAETHLFEVSALPRDIVPHTCDAVVLAGACYFDRFPKKLTRFATEQRTNLAKVTSVFVAVSGAARTAAGRERADEDARRFAGVTGWAPDRIELVAGGEPYTRYGFFTRWFMVRHSKKLGRTVDPKVDYDFTDWDDVDRIARSLVGAEVHDPALALM